ncbi:MAG: EamA family transporter, partial [Actinomycetes bacterium]
AVFPSLGSYLLWNLALKRTTAANAGNYLNLIAVFTAVITVVLGQPITAPQILGGALVISGVLLTSAGGKERQRPRSSKSTSSPPSPSPAEFRPR